MISMDLLMAIVRRDYCETPALRLTFAQACRLWHLDPAMCERVLGALLKERFLRRTAEGVFALPPEWFDPGGRRARRPRFARRRRLVPEAA